ncbi:hypothetical protein HDU98_006126 [Podochytrium sp. JEL0797]|nr:hypothetical protein HDU98_006126 [Podochytrium sp. JEL0797]
MFHSTTIAHKRVPYLLADIGEGITECEIIQWFVKEGDQIEQFTKICEVQSDKASVEITSRYDGVVGKLYYAKGDMAKVGAPLVDIETEEVEEASSKEIPVAPVAPVAPTPTPTAPAFPAVSGTKKVPFLLADIGEGITECELIQWFVKEGDVIEQFSKICEVQSDKASVEITSRYDGVVGKLYYAKGDMAKVGSPLVDIEMEDASATAPAESIAPTPTAPTAAAPAIQNAPFQKPAAKSEILTTPAVRRVAREQGVDLALVTPTGKNGRITEQDVLHFKSNPTPPTPIADNILATTGVRRVAREQGVDLALVKGTAKRGRITKEDVLNFKERPVSATTPTSLAPPAASPTQTSPTPQDELKPLTAIQKAMFKHMTKSLSIPHFGYSDTVTLDAATAFRTSVNAFLAKNPYQGVSKISYMPIFMKALSLALVEFPILNAKVVGGEGDVGDVRLLYRGEHNIGVAMDTPFGLIVPNIKNIHQKSILDIAVDLSRLQTAAKTGLSKTDLSGGTITLSNIGTIGGNWMHPVIVTSEVCIGALGKTERLPRFETIDGVEKVVGKEVMPVSWNADHRVVDGATMARFVQLWKRYLENPVLMAVVTK